jgi:gamma-glutamyl hercynylcysteine S-oxide synthase
MVEIPGGRATLGISRDDPEAFGWDNEYEATTVDVPAFAIDRYKVTNSEYLSFIQAGGYQERSLWTSDAWDWKARLGITHPLFWSSTAGPGKTDSWRYRAMFEEIPLPLEWPVYISHAEAAAYAAWAGKRLPTEAEWHRAAYGAPEARTGPARPLEPFGTQGVSAEPGSVVRASSSEDAERDFPWGAEPPEARHGYFGFRRWDPSPVNGFPAGRSAFGVEGLLANGWEWTASFFEPFAGFQPFPFYEGYSANFFDRMHYVMKGGSPRTERSMLRRSFRNWFQPHYQQVYAGFRCAGK